MCEGASMNFTNWSISTVLVLLGGSLVITGMSDVVPIPYVTPAPQINSALYREMLMIGGTSILGVGVILGVIQVLKDMPNSKVSPNGRKNAEINLSGKSTDEI